MTDLSDIEQIDIAGCATAEVAARNTGMLIREVAEAIGQDPDLEVSVEKAENRHGDGHHWEVRWPGGPFEWAMVLTGGESLFSAEYPGLREGPNTPEVSGFYDNGEWDVEAESRSVLGFYPR